MICEYYKTKSVRQTRYDPITGSPHQQLKTVGYCSGTKENDVCNCNGDAENCDFYPEKRKPKRLTNYERIRAMSIEEMIEFLDNFQSCTSCRRYGNNCFPVFNIEEWLKSEVDNYE